MLLQVAQLKAKLAEERAVKRAEVSDLEARLSQHTKKLAEERAEAGPKD